MARQPPATAAVDRAKTTRRPPTATVLRHRHYVSVESRKTTGFGFSLLKTPLLLLALLMGQYCFARWRLSSVVVYNAAGGRAGRPPGAWAVGRHWAGRMRDRAVDTARRASVIICLRVRPVRATFCSSIKTQTLQ